MLIMIAALLVVFGGIFGWKWYVGMRMAKAEQSKQAPVATVSAITASNEVWHPMLQAVATLRAVQGTDVSPQLAGQVSEIRFESGQQVKKGDLLVQQDTSVEQAQLRGLQAAEDLARVNLTRVQDLAKTRIVSKSDLDQAEATYKQARAAVVSQQQLIDLKSIRAPFSGLLGIRQIDLGDYLAPGAMIVTLQSLDPIYADFSLPQEQFSKLKAGQPVTLQVDAYPGSEFPGSISAINSKVTETTRNIDVRAALTNLDLKLRPGMFGEVHVELTQPEQHVTVPVTAITYNPYGDSIFVIYHEATNRTGQAAFTVQRVFVQTGERRGTQIAVLKGLRAGAEVVTSGQMKLQQGSRVRIDNSITPPNEVSTSPPDEH